MPEAQAPKDLFGTEVWAGSAWQIQGAVLEIAEADNLVITSANIQYNRSVQQFNPINKARRYLVTGQPSGTVSLGNIIGPEKGLKTFIQNFSDVCKINENIIKIKPSGTKACTSNTNTVFTLHGCLISTMGFQVQQGANGISFVSGGLSMSFFYLDMTE